LIDKSKKAKSKEGKIRYISFLLICFFPFHMGMIGFDDRRRPFVRLEPE